MSPNFQYTKQCHRCPLVVRLTREQFEKEKDQAETTCDRCRAILTAEADEILKHLEPVKSKCPVWPEGSASWPLAERRRFAEANCSYEQCCLHRAGPEINRCYAVPGIDFPKAEASKPQAPASPANPT